MRRASRLLLLALPVAAIAGVLAVTAAWWLATTRLAAAAEAWRQARAAEGYVATWAQVGRGGWPLRAVVVLPGITVATDTPGLPDALAWQADEVRLVYTPWRPGELVLRLGGAQSVQAGAAPAVAVTADRLEGTVGLGGETGVVTVSASGLLLPFPAGAVQAGSVGVRLQGTEMDVSVSRLSLPGHALPFGGAVAWLEAHARSTVAVPRLRDPRAALAAWQAAGGALRLDGVSLRWGKLDVTGQGTLGLDAAMQPAGSFAVRLTGFADAIDVLVRAGALTRNDGRVMATLLGLLSTPGPDGVAQAELPLTLRGRVLSTGALPLLRLPVVSLP